MEGFTPLQINLNGDDAWPELREQEFGHGMATHVAVLANGTAGGKPSVAIRGKLDDGTEVVLETPWNLCALTQEARSAATSRRLPTWVRWELRLVFVGTVTMNVWSPWGEPWWWRLMFLAAASVCVAGLWAERQ